MKKKEKEDKEKEKRKRMIQREQNEAEVCNELLLIYPFIGYEMQFQIEDFYEEEEKKL